MFVYLSYLFSMASLSSMLLKAVAIVVDYHPPLSLEVNIHTQTEQRYHSLMLPFSSLLNHHENVLSPHRRVIPSN